MQTQLISSASPYFNNFLEVIEDTIIRYTKNGRWFEMHRTNAMLSMFQIEKGTSFKEISRGILKSIIYNFHERESIDVTQEVMEENFKEEV